MIIYIYIYIYIEREREREKASASERESLKARNHRNCSGSPSKLNKGRTSLVAQGLRIHLPVWGTWVQSLVWENPTSFGAM